MKTLDMCRREAAWRGEKSTPLKLSAGTDQGAGASQTGEVKSKPSQRGMELSRIDRLVVKAVGPGRSAFRSTNRSLRLANRIDLHVFRFGWNGSVARGC